MRHINKIVKAINAEELLAGEGLPSTSEALLEEFYVKVEATGRFLSVDMAPKSGEGHDYMFRVGIL